MRQSRAYTTYSRSNILFKTPTNRSGIYLSGKTIGFFVFLAILGGLTWCIFYSPTFSIKSVIYEGALPDELKFEADKIKGQNIFRFSTSGSTKNLAGRFLQVDNLVVSKGIPDTIKVKGEPRQAIMVWKTQNKKWLVDKNGLIFGTFDEDTTENILPLLEDSQNLAVELGMKIIDRSFTDFIRYIREHFSESGLEIKLMAIGESTFSLEVQTNNGLKVYFDTTRSANSQLANLSKVVQNYGSDIHEYIDLRVNGNAYYK